MVGVVCIRGRKDVISHVCPDILGVVVPRHRRRHAADGTDLPSASHLSTRVNIALDIVLTPLPCPGSAPSHAVAG